MRSSSILRTAKMPKINNTINYKNKDGSYGKQIQAPGYVET